jgi:hypothetical protein
VSGVAPIGLIISRGRCFVFIRATQVCLSANPSKPFGFGSGRFRQWLSAPSVRERCVTASVPPSGAGRNARKQSRLFRYSTDIIIIVKRKNRVLPPFLLSLLWKSLWKNCGYPVDILWKTCEAFLPSQVIKIIIACGKTKKKNYFL